MTIVVEWDVKYKINKPDQTTLKFSLKNIYISNIYQFTAEVLMNYFSLSIILTRH